MRISILLALFIMLFSIPAIAEKTQNYEIDNLSEIVDGAEFSETLESSVDEFDQGSYLLTAVPSDGVAIFSEVTGYFAVRENSFRQPSPTLQAIYLFKRGNGLLSFSSSVTGDICNCLTVIET